MVGVNHEPGVIPAAPWMISLRNLAGTASKIPSGTGRASPPGIVSPAVSPACFISRALRVIQLLKGFVCAPRTPYKPSPGSGRRRDDVLAGKGLGTPGELLLSKQLPQHRWGLVQSTNSPGDG